MAAPPRFSTWAWDWSEPRASSDTWPLAAMRAPDSRTVSTAAAETAEIAVGATLTPRDRVRTSVETSARLPESQAPESASTLCPANRRTSPLVSSRASPRSPAATVGATRTLAGVAPTEAPKERVMALETASASVRSRANSSASPLRVARAPSARAASTAVVMAAATSVPLPLAPRAPPLASPTASTRASPRARRLRPAARSTVPASSARRLPPMLASARVTPTPTMPPTPTDRASASAYRSASVSSATAPLASMRVPAPRREVISGLAVAVASAPATPAVRPPAPAMAIARAPWLASATPASSRFRRVERVTSSAAMSPPDSVKAARVGVTRALTTAPAAPKVMPAPMPMPSARASMAAVAARVRSPPALTSAASPR